MSDQEIESSTPEPPEDVQIPEPVAARKPLSENRLAQLAKARERAAEVKRERKEQKLRDQVKVLDQPDPPQKKEEMAAMNPVLIVEQSESDDDSFEGPPGVLFVKRRRQKKPERSREEVQMDFAYHRMFPSF